MYSRRKGTGFDDLARCNGGKFPRRRTELPGTGQTLFLKRGELRIQVLKGAIELVAIALILAHLQILLHAFTRENQHLFPAIHFNLCVGQLGLRLTAGFQFGLLNLAFDSLAFPTSCHAPHSKGQWNFAVFYFRRVFKECRRFASHTPAQKEWNEIGKLRAPRASSRK
jgi:hypothetical protein